MPLDPSIKKVLVIGSGPIVIGQAAEFDYAGAQACRVLKTAGLDVVLVNSNPATIMTDQALADEIYLEPLTVDTLKRIIRKEKPDSLLAGLGGQTGLTIAMQLSKDGWLEQEGVRLLGTNAESIDRAEDRELFKETMDKLGQPTVPSEIANDIDTALQIAEKIGYPVIIRPAFTLGGSGGGVAYNRREMLEVAGTGLTMSPIHQILVEKYIFGWKEIEFETMRDSAGNVIAVCSMENVDPVGVHTGDSIVVAPALTLSEPEYTMLHNASLAIVEELGIVGGCNCQFALDPNSFEYSVIEVNPRVSRSSALASKATGYPIAKITTMVALGYTLDEIRNDITGCTCACFEPTVDYVVLKFPKWPFDKFVTASRTLGTQMKATGEVMSIAPSFEMALMKAVRGAEIKLDTLNMVSESTEPLLERLKKVDDHRIFTVFEALKKGISVDGIYEITRIDRWFLNRIKNLADFEIRIASGLSDEDYFEGKRLGYTDAALRRLSGREDLPHQDAVYKMVDTCGAEFAAQTPYFYSTYDTDCESRSFQKSGKPRIMVLGSGPIRIGQGIEFDYSSVHCVWTLQEQGYEVVIINNNPETVSTDYDTADRLYFEPLCEEDVMNVIKAEDPVGVVVAFGGQTAIKLTQFLDKNGIKIFGTSADGIDLAEDRERFDAMLGKLDISRPSGQGIMTTEEALQAAETLGYPVLLRPSYVIGGQNMTIAHSEADVNLYMERILSTGIENPVLVDKYMEGTELEVDVISDGVDVLIPGVMEHVERAGVHSGDSIAVYPPFSITDKMLKTVIDCSTRLALAIGTKGLVNIQYLIYHSELYVIEVNPRASRTIPYISKVTGVPMVDLAAKVMIGQSLKDLGYGTGLYKTPPYYTAKVPVFSFEKLLDVNSTLGPEMKSTGEVLGIGKDLNEALFKGLTAAGFNLQPAMHTDDGVLLSVVERDINDAIQFAKKLDDMGLRIYATPDTAEAISRLGIDVIPVKSIREEDNAFKILESGHIRYVVYTGALYDDTLDDYIALHRRALQLAIPCFTSMDTANSLASIIASRYNQFNTELVDICHMRHSRHTLKFSKMQGTGNDYIFIDNRDGKITFPESLCVSLCERHYGVGGYGIVLIENSGVADASMRIFNRDGSEGMMAGNAIRCVAKYLYDNDIVKKENMTIQTASGVRRLDLYTRNGKVTSVCVHMGKADLRAASLPTTLPGEKIVDLPVTIGEEEYRITCASIGNPHCVVFCDRVDGVDIETIGPLFEHAEYFPERINTEFIRVVNGSTVKMRVYERGNGETWACGTGACAAVIAAVENGKLSKGRDITVKVRGGDLIVNYTDEEVTLTGDAILVYEGTLEY
ncbi:MAG: carbamoyl-phosphate synthase large subunit [Ruminococcaceae bacterium]|nr:carbamoyl-phosphate synthase large subunit [Oscillospiraceae bacterium]